jgi:hypothetical protein
MLFLSVFQTNCNKSCNKYRFIINKIITIPSEYKDISIDKKNNRGYFPCYFLSIYEILHKKSYI